MRILGFAAQRFGKIRFPPRISNQIFPTLLHIEVGPSLIL